MDRFMNYCDFFHYYICIYYIALMKDTIFMLEYAIHELDTDNRRQNTSAKTYIVITY